MIRSTMWTLGLSALVLGCSGDKDDDGTDVGADTDTDTDTDSDTDADTDADADADTDADTDTDTEMGNSIVDIAVGNPDFSILVEAVVKAGLVETLDGTTEYTVFAPTNAAFTAAGIDVDALSVDELTDVLLYHVVAGSVPSDSVPALANSAAEWTLFFDTSMGVMVNDAEVTTPDIMADNGIIHVIDKVLLPPTIVDAAVYAGLDNLVGAVGAADPAVAALLSGPGDFTVFAPTNAAFDAVSGVTAGLSQAELTSVLTYHVVGGRVLSTAVPPVAPTLLQNSYGNYVSAIIDTTSGVTVNGAPVVIADVLTTNGVVHVIDGVLLPPTVVDLAVHAGLTGLLDTVGAASGDLGTVLSGGGPFTVFAPDNQAFTDIAGVAAGLSPDQLRDILLFHVVGGASPVTSGDLSNGEVPSLLGQTLTVDLTAGVMIEDATVTLPDVHGTNGVVHVIDTVMLPPSN